MKFLRAVLIFTVFFGRGAFAQTTIDVVVLFTDESGFSLTERLLKIEEYKAFANGALLLSGITDRQYEFHSGGAFTPLNYASSAFTGKEGITWMESENNKPISIFSSIRESAAGGNGADVVLLVTSTYVDTGKASCGIAGGGEGREKIPLQISESNRDSYAFAMIKTIASCDEPEITVPHELGHILYAEHQAFHYQDLSISRDLNNSFSLPRSYNHADTNGVTHSLMYTPEIFEPGQVIVQYSGFTQALTSPGSNITNLLTNVNDSWNVVGAYRPLLPPVVTGSAEFFGCNGNFGQFLVTWWEILNGTFADRFDVEYRSGPNWYSYYQGGEICLAYSSSGTFSTFRVRGVNLRVGPGLWVEFFADHTCNSGGGGPDPL